MAGPVKEDGQRQKASVLGGNNDGANQYLHQHFFSCSFHSNDRGKQQEIRPSPKLAQVTPSMITTSDIFPVLYCWQVVSQPWEVNRKENNLLVLKMRKLVPRETISGGIKYSQFRFPDPQFHACTSILLCPRCIVVQIQIISFLFIYAFLSFSFFIQKMVLLIILSLPGLCEN